MQFMNLVYCISGPGMPQDVAAVEIPLDPDSCVILIKWNSPSNMNSTNIDQYIIQTSNKNGISRVNENFTMVTFLTSCKEIRNLYMNITAVDRCERVGKSTTNFQPRIMVTESPVTSISRPTHPSTTANTPVTLPPS